MFHLKYVYCRKKYPSHMFNATSPLPCGHSPIAQINSNLLQDCTSFARGEDGTHIDRNSPLIMPLRLRGGFATECRAFSHCASSSALKGSPPCGSSTSSIPAYMPLLFKILARYIKNVKRNKSLSVIKKRIHAESFFSTSVFERGNHSDFSVSLSLAIVDISIFFISMHFSRIILSE